MLREWGMGSCSGVYSACHPCFPCRPTLARREIEADRHRLQERGKERKDESTLNTEPKSESVHMRVTRDTLGFEGLGFISWLCHLLTAVCL